MSAPMSNHRGSIPIWLTSSYLEETFQKKQEDNSLKITNLDIEPGSAEGDNYVCKILRISVTYNNGRKLSAIVKIKPDTKLLTQGLNFDLFEIEAKFFELVFPKFKAILGERTYLPECLYIDQTNSTIILEDLREKGFRMEERGKFLGIEHTELVIDALASFHGASLNVLKEEPELIKGFQKFLWQDPLPNVLVSMTKNSVSAIEKHLSSYGLPEKYCKIIQKIQNEIDNGKMKVTESKEGNLNVLCHGDNWKNNLLFHFNNGIADDVKLLDFQIINYNSFANDLHYLLFFNVSSDILINNLDALLERYYRKVKEIAPDTPEWTLDRVKEEFHERYYFGYILAVLYRPFVISQSPVDIELTMDGGALQDNGFQHPEYISDLNKLFPFFEKVGLFN